MVDDCHILSKHVTNQSIALNYYQKMQEFYQDGNNQETEIFYWNAQTALAINSLQIHQSKLAITTIQLQIYNSINTIPGFVNSLSTAALQTQIDTLNKEIAQDKKTVQEYEEKAYEVSGGVAALVLGLLIVVGGLVVTGLFIWR